MPTDIKQLQLKYRATQEARLPRLCGLRAYCNAQRLAGYEGPCCPHCEQVTFLVDLWSRIFGVR